MTPKFLTNFKLLILTFFFQFIADFHFPCQENILDLRCEGKAICHSYNIFGLVM